VIAKLLNCLNNKFECKQPGGGDKNGRKETRLWVWMYRAKTEKYKNESRRKEAQKVQITHENNRMQD
jgi:hypothetical protein